MMKLPELLSPAGSFQSFEAAIEGGADAIYVGGASFNARINAKNFDEQELKAAVRLAHTYGIKVYQTINIMILGKECDELIKNAVKSAEIGIDAFIVSDLGAAQVLHRIIPEMPLHASTQMSIHSIGGAKMLEKHGFSRVVPARELSFKDIFYMTENSPLETEIFIHGAMCVSHSGQCLFSSVVGGRSGNRGLCAQPCRLPYSARDKKCDAKYPLSLKDMSLANHIKEIINSKVSSLKIEGRMKSPEYVYGVTKIYRSLLDEKRDATADEIQRLSELFSRGGFSDGYFVGQVGKNMLGVRSDEDKLASREIDKFSKISRKRPIDIEVCLSEGERAELSLTCRDISVTVYGDAPERAINAPIDESDVRKCMSKLGDTCFSLSNIDIKLNGRIMVPVSKLNALRREGVAALEAAMNENSSKRVEQYSALMPKGKPFCRQVGRFLLANQVTRSAREFFDIVLLPLREYVSNSALADGFIMPPVIFDSETDEILSLLSKASSLGAKYALVSNLAQIEPIKDRTEAALIADIRFNTANNESVRFFEELGFESVVLSAELTLPQIRDVKGAKAAIVYGRLPLMTLEKCVIKEIYSDGAPKGSGRACEICKSRLAQMKDRRGFVFPIVRELPHRNVVLNSVPTQMSDRQDELSAAGITDRHFLFTVESGMEVDEVIADYVQARAPKKKVRRI